jgi:hypothetical protein
MQRQTGSPADSPFAHCATCGAWHETSQRFASFTALHMLPVRPAIELDVPPAPSIVT